MTIENTKVLDVVGVEKGSGTVVLTISDHLPWGVDDRHLALLEEKIRSYVAFIENGQLFERYPNAQERGIEIRVIYQHEPDESGEDFLQAAGGALSERGIAFSHGTLPLRYQ